MFMAGVRTRVRTAPGVLQTSPICALYENAAAHFFAQPGSPPILHVQRTADSSARRSEPHAAQSRTPDQPLRPAVPAVPGAMAALPARPGVGVKDMSDEKLTGTAAGPSLKISDFP